MTTLIFGDVLKYYFFFLNLGTVSLMDYMMTPVPYPLYLHPVPVLLRCRRYSIRYSIRIIFLPLMESSEISVIYMGTTLQVKPIMIPATNLATYKVMTFCEKVISMDIPVHIAAPSIRQNFLPNKSATIPAGSAPHMAPNGNRAAIQFSSLSLVIKNGAELFLFFRNCKPGDVHAKWLPTIREPMHAAT